MLWNLPCYIIWERESSPNIVNSSDTDNLGKASQKNCFHCKKSFFDNKDLKRHLSTFTHKEEPNQWQRGTINLISHKKLLKHNCSAFWFEFEHQKKDTRLCCQKKIGVGRKQMNFATRVLQFLPIVHAGGPLTLITIHNCRSSSICASNV